MSIIKGAMFVSDSRRDADKYYKLLLAIENATGKIYALDKEGRTSIDEVLAGLLPDLAESLDAAQAFVAVYQQNSKARHKGFDLVATYPKMELSEPSLPWSKMVNQVLTDGRPRVVEPFEDVPGKLIHGLEIFNATTAILVRMQIGGRSRIIGVCNRSGPGMGPFLSSDRRTLEGIIELIAIGLRVGERRRQELENIQNISAAISAELNPDDLLPLVARKAAEAFSAPATSLMLWDKGRENLIIEASHGLSAGYVRGQRIPKQKVNDAIAAYENENSIVIPNLRRNSFGEGGLIRAERLYSSLIAKLQVSNELIGVLNIYSQNTPRPFSADERELAEIFANHAAIAINNARLAKKEEKKRKHLEAVINASKVITASVGLGHQEILEKILEQAVETVKGSGEQKATLGTMQRFDEKNKELIFEYVYPTSILPELKAEIGDCLPLETAKSGERRRGISVRAANSRKPQLIHDVSIDSDYVVYHDKTKSELSVPLLDGDNLIGVLDVESDEVHAFDEEDMEALQALAGMAVVALRNAEQAEMLTRSNAVGVMGAWGAEIVHVVNREVGCIRRGVYLIQQRPDIPAEVREELNTIDQSANRLAMPEIPDRLPGYEATPLPASSDIDSAIHTAVEADRPRYPSISFRFEAGCPDVRVAMHERFIFTILRNLLRNAIHALSSESVIEKTIWVRSRIDGSMAMIEMENSGPNLRTEIAPFIFKRLIPHGDGRKGRGLLLVGFIIEQHGGKIETIQIEGKGVTFRFWLPLAPSQEHSVETK